MKNKNEAVRAGLDTRHDYLQFYFETVLWAYMLIWVSMTAVMIRMIGFQFQIENYMQIKIKEHINKAGTWCRGCARSHVPPIISPLLNPC